MIEIRVRFPAFVLRTYENGKGGWVELERSIEDGTTVIQLLSDLVTSYPGFREGLFNPETGTVSEQIGVGLNNQLLTFDEITQIKLGNNDTVVILPIYSGG